MSFFSWAKVAIVQTIKRVVNKIKHIIRKGKPVFGMKSLRKEENLKIYPNINKAKKLLGYKPKFKIDNGYQKYIDWYKKMFREQKIKF